MKHCDDRRGTVYVGEILGGGTRINSMLYTRGTAADYDAWASSGHPNWAYEKVLPYFVKGENNLDHPKSTFRGTSGLLFTLFRICYFES